MACSEEVGGERRSDESRMVLMGTNVGQTSHHVALRPCGRRRSVLSILHGWVGADREQARLRRLLCEDQAQRERIANVMRYDMT